MKKIGIFLGHPKFFTLLFSIGKSLENQGYKVEYITESKLFRFCYSNFFCAKKITDYSNLKGEINFYKKTFINLYNIKNIDYYINKKLKNISKLDNYDLIIFWNGLNSLEYEIALKNNLNIVCIENGYVNNTLQVARRGVNALSETVNYAEKDFRKLLNKYNDIISNIEINNIEIVKSNRIKNFILGIERLFLFGFSNFFRILIFYFKEYFFKIKQDKILKSKKNNEEEKFNNIKNKKNIFFVFQVHDDTQIFINSNLKNSLDLLNKFNKIKDYFKGYNLVVKIHPKDIGRFNYEKELKKKNITYFYTGNSDDFIDISDYIFLINSSVGFQALKKGKKVISFGKVLYKKSKLLLDLSDDDLDGNIIKEFLFSKEYNNGKYLSLLEKYLFIKGTWNKVDEKLLKEIIKKVFYYLNIKDEN